MRSDIALDGFRLTGLCWRGASLLENVGSDRGRVSLEEFLVEIGVGQWNGAGGVEAGDLFGGECPAKGTEVLQELFFVSRADDDGGDGGALE